MFLGVTILWARSSMSTSPNFDAVNGGEDSLRQEWVLAFLPYSQGLPGCVCRDGSMLKSPTITVLISCVYIHEFCTFLNTALRRLDQHVTVFNLRLFGAHRSDGLRLFLLPLIFNFRY